MCVVHFCGSRDICPYDAIIRDRIELVIVNEITASEIKRLISEATRIPVDHLKIYQGKDLELLEDQEQCQSSDMIHFTVTPCDNPKHCPGIIHIATVFGQIRLPIIPQMKIADLKVSIARAIKDASPVKQKLTFQGTVLKDDRTVETYHIVSGSRIELVSKP